MITDTEKTIEKIRKVARRHGWAIGVHGSLKRDIDLIGTPWTFQAVNWYELIIRIKDELKYQELGQVSIMPHGRKGFLLRDPKATYTRVPKGKWKPMVIDISLVDPRVENPNGK